MTHFLSQDFFADISLTFTKFPDTSQTLTAIKFPDISIFFRQVATLFNATTTNGWYC